MHRIPFLRKTSIKRKQMLVVMLTSTVALLVACVAFAFYEVTTFRSAMAQNLSTLADIIGDNSAAALDFGDPKAATETLSALKNESHITGACIYTAKGDVFAEYDRPNDGLIFIPPRQNQALYFAKNSLDIFRPIVRNGEMLGTVYVNSDLNELYARLYRYALIAVGVFFVSGLAAILISSQLQQFITTPILNLVKTAQTVTLEKNYSVRAIKHGEDELGVLIDAFNEMLKQIQERDVALQQSHLELENRVLDRTQEVVHSLSLVRATLESTTDGIVVTDAIGQIASFNEKFIEIWKIPHEVMESRDLNLINSSVLACLKDPKEFLSRVEVLIAHAELESFDVLGFKDGRVIERYSKPQRIQEKSVGRVWSFRDVTERTRAEAAMVQMHEQLLDTSRQAGMAEVATSVLHNVGNVLNSINVSSTVISDRVRKSKVVSLAKVVALLHEHEADLAHFLTIDPKGRQLPGYLKQLGEHLMGEQAALLEELALLHQNIEHVKDIVVMQQGYAKISGFVETVKITDLIEDALRLNLGALQRHGVKVRREFEDIPLMELEKHKILQILVNLVRNAKYACDESLQLDKLITLRAVLTDNKIIISVADNGIGIPAENLTRIFNHGFTTRKEGHGFGLHSAALAATEMEGSLRVHSDGRGFGATFTLELPYHPHENAQEHAAQS
jgi:signal transduction histidine kinase